MFRLRSFFLLFVVCMLAILLPGGAHSQLRVVPTLPVEDVPQQSAASENPATPETGVDTTRFYDNGSPDVEKLQKGNEMRAGLPLDKRGAIDWMKALRSGAIAPRADLYGTQRPQVLDLDILLKNTKEMPYVKFPHNSHTEWLACSNCHDKIFVPKAGANPITMEKIFRGEYCGTCHDRVAFITHYSCERCHSVPQGNGKKWW